MKILSDFDGVWTDQAFEARSVMLYLSAEAARLAGVPADEAAEHFAAFERVVRLEPYRYGWAPDGRITAFVDEDPFCVPNAVACYLGEERANQLAWPYRDAILASDHESLTHFVDHCFMRATTEFRDQHPPALVAGAAEVVERLHAAGVEVVVVSNSPSAKIESWFRAVGIDAGETTDHALRVRGSAGKQTLGKTDVRISVGDRRVHVDRPLYQAILAEERPELVIGDVFSLDLALPWVLRRDGLPGAPRSLVLRRHKHTPAWVLELAQEGKIDRIVESVAELGDLVLSNDYLPSPSRR